MLYASLSVPAGACLLDAMGALSMAESPCVNKLSRMPGCIGQNFLLSQNKGTPHRGRGGEAAVFNITF
jgi:hypothetical protein